MVNKKYVKLVLVNKKYVKLVFPCTDYTAFATNLHSEERDEGLLKF